ATYVRTRGKAKDPTLPDPIVAGVAAHHLEWILDSELDLILRARSDWRPLSAPPSQGVWTDDYANVLAALRF
ncbi:MAG TPA: hypothetical protein VM580_07125, partial [Labilithrix sp.]|nr:hypothetical protein [Labilithrix sp.]